MDSQKYSAECMIQLSNRNHYEQLGHNTPREFLQQIIPVSMKTTIIYEKLETYVLLNNQE